MTLTTDAPRAAGTAVDADLDRLAIDTIRVLSAEMVQAANSGHPGMPLGAAPMAWTLWSRHLRHDPHDPTWVDRDRFVLSAGHGSALLYSLLHLTGYDLPAEELARFRQLGSATPGHPEFGHTAGVECTTGPLGQGLAMAVGMALAEAMQAARFPEVTDHRTWVIAGDGCLMEGISQEAISLAGHLRLGKLTVLWDDNDITIDGRVSQSSSDDQVARFAASGWHTIRVEDGTDVEAIDAALTAATHDPRPTFVAVRTLIGQGARAVQDTSKAHGSPLGAGGLADLKNDLGWTEAPFTVPQAVRERCAELAAAGVTAHRRWDDEHAVWSTADPVAAQRFAAALTGNLPDDLEAVVNGAVSAGDRATRQSSGAILAALAARMPELVGGSADLAGSTGTPTKGPDGIPPVSAADRRGAVINFGIREFAMSAILNGLSLHGGFRPFGSTFLVFSDYQRAAIRLAALMGQPTIHLLTHDSVAVGEDGPTHQPIEHVESLRLIPGLRVLRPADDHETAAAWFLALRDTSMPTAMILTRQAVPQLPHHDQLAWLNHYGARVVAWHGDQTLRPDVDLLATGSEVGLACAAAELLTTDGRRVRVISVPWRERFATRRDSFGQRAAYTVSIEAGVTSGWRGIADLAIGIDTFGASGPGDEVLAHFGFTPDQVAARVEAALAEATP